MEEVFKPYLLDDREELRVLFYRISEQTSPEILAAALTGCGHSGRVSNERFSTLAHFRNFICEMKKEQRDKFIELVNARFTERK